MIGARLGNWYLECELAHGTQGVVYAARAFDDSNRRAAVKVLTTERAREPGFLQRFPAELLVLHGLDHPNIVRLYDSGTHAGMPWYASELVEGTDLATRLEGGRLPWKEVFTLAVQAARALRHGHSRKILHRDLKPSHFLITADGTLKLADFGTARIIPQPPTSPTPPLGSGAYLPPENAGGKPLTRRSDFYSLGGVLYSAATGRPPFAAATVVELLHKICYTLPERAGLIVPDLPSEFDEFLRNLLDKNVARRPVSAAAILDDLDRLRGKLERKRETVAVPPDPGTRTMEPLAAEAEEQSPSDRDESRGSSKVRFAILLALFLAAVGGLGYAFFWPGPDAESLAASARPLLDSPNPADWDRAWDEYLEPLSRRFPDRFVEEVAGAKARIQDHREQRRTIAAGAAVEAKSDAERFYLRGLRLAQAGDVDSARKTWQAMRDAFGPVESEKRWVDLARDGLKDLDQQNRRNPATDRRSLNASLEAAKVLRQSGKTVEADSAFMALRELYRNDADALEMIEKAQQ